MKIKLVLLLCCVGNLSAGTIYSQQTTFDVEYHNQTLASVFGELKARTGYNFTYDKAVVNESTRVNASLKDATLEQILDQVLATNGYSYQIDNKIVYISLARHQQQPQRARLTNITGTVTNAAGTPVAGASVYVKGSSHIGTITDATGTFRLNISNAQNPVIVVSFIGMKPREFTPTTENQGTLVLEMEENRIGEVTVSVNTGYRDIPRDRMTGAYTTVTAKELEGGNFMSIDQALAGKVAGLVSTLTTGELGARSDVRIRGNNSITGYNEPLWVVDGFRCSRVSCLLAA